MQTCASMLVPVCAPCAGCRTLSPQADPQKKPQSVPKLSCAAKGARLRAGNPQRRVPQGPVRFLPLWEHFFGRGTEHHRSVGGPRPAPRRCLRQGSLRPRLHIIQRLGRAHGPPKSPRPICAFGGTRRCARRTARPRISWFMMRGPKCPGATADCNIYTWRTKKKGGRAARWGCTLFGGRCFSGMSHQNHQERTQRTPQPTAPGSTTPPCPCWFKYACHERDQAGSRPASCRQGLRACAAARHAQAPGVTRQALSRDDRAPRTTRPQPPVSKIAVVGGVGAMSRVCSPFRQRARRATGVHHLLKGRGRVRWRRRQWVMTRWRSWCGGHVNCLKATFHILTAACFTSRSGDFLLNSCCRGRRSAWGPNGPVATLNLLQLY